MVTQIWFRRIPVWLKFQGDVLDQTDVVNAIMESQGFNTRFYATANPNPVYNPGLPLSYYDYVWYGSGAVPVDGYMPGTMETCLPPGATYKAGIKKDTAGNVEGVWFWRLT